MIKPLTLILLRQPLTGGVKYFSTAFYQAMFEEWVILEPLSDKDLQDLGQRRAEAIVKEFKTISGLDPVRVTTGSEGSVVKPLTNTVNTSLTLDVLKPAA
jgi:hypothetical protein